jgi:hypothetical protein
MTSTLMDEYWYRPAFRIYIQSSADDLRPESRSVVLGILRSFEEIDVTACVSISVFIHVT